MGGWQQALEDAAREKRERLKETLRALAAEARAAGENSPNKRQRQFNHHMRLLFPTAMDSLQQQQEALTSARLSARRSEGSVAESAETPALSELGPQYEPSLTQTDLSELMMRDLEAQIPVLQDREEESEGDVPTAPPMSVPPSSEEDSGDSEGAGGDGDSEMAELERKHGQNLQVH